MSNAQGGPCPNSAPSAVESSIRSKVRAYIIGNFLLGAAENFDDATQMIESGVLDSTSAMELVAFLEETFQIVVDEDEIIPENLNSVDSICSYVVRKSP